MAANNSALQLVRTNDDALQQSLRSDAGVGFSTLDSQTQILTLDSVCRRHYGLDNNIEVNTELVLKCIHPEDRAGFEGMFYEVATLKERNKTSNKKQRHRVTLEEGKHRYLEMFLRMDDAGCFHGILLDVTESMESQEILEAERHRFQQFATQVPARYCFVDLQGRIRFMSNEYRDALNMAGEDVIGKTVLELFGEEFCNSTRPMLEKALSGETQIWQDNDVSLDGTLYHDIVTYQPHRDSAGNIIGISTLRVDITQAHELEMELREAQSHLMRSNADLEQFAYVASHDLKAPLRAIQVLVEWLAEDLVDYNEGDVQENIELLGKRASRLSSLLDDLLAYSRAGRQHEPSSDIDLQELVAEIAQLIDTGDDTIVEWVGDCTPVLQTDHAALHQVMRNLIGNAIKHHPEPQCLVRVSAELQDELVEVAIQDNGEGINPEFSEKIFQMFQTLKPRDEVEGSGMGLAIVKRLVNHHGGEIWFETPSNGVGTTFKFTWQRNAINAAKNTQAKKEA